MLFISMTWIGVAVAGPSPADAALLCEQGSFTTPPPPGAFLTLLGAQAAERTEPALVEAYEACLRDRFALSPRQARCYAIYERICESPLEWRTVDASVNGLAAGAEPSFAPLFTADTADTAPATSGLAVEEGLPWAQDPGAGPVWTPGASSAPAGPTPAGQEIAATGWESFGSASVVTLDDPTAWWFDTENRAAWDALSQALDAAASPGADTARAQREVERVASGLDRLLADNGLNHRDFAEREARYACTVAAAGKGVTTPDAARVRSAMVTTRSAWNEVATAYNNAGAAGLADARACLGHKLLILRAYNERVGSLYREALVALDACDAETFLEKQALLDVAVGRTHQLSAEARSCIAPTALGTAQTVVSVESGLVDDDDDPFEPFEDVLAPIGQDPMDGPLVDAKPVSPFE